MSSAFVVKKPAVNVERINFACKVYGPRSSLTPELYSILLAIRILKYPNIKIYSDSKGEISLLEAFYRDPWHLYFRSTDHPNAPLLFNSCNYFKSYFVEFKHIKGHSGDVMNYDGLAKQGVMNI